MSTNNLNLYDPEYYAQEGLIQLEAALGMANRVHRGYDKAPQEKGSTISINKPSTFEEKDAPSTDQDLNPGQVTIDLDYWKEVKFSLTDKELTFTGEKIISDHIRPAAYALASGIDTRLNLLARDIPWYYDVASTTEFKDITRVRKVLFDNLVPMNDGLLHYAVGGDMQAGFEELFGPASYSGDNKTQNSGYIGIKSGLEIFATQNIGSHTKGTASTGTLAVNTATSKGETIIKLDAASVTGTLVPGDTFVVAGNKQRYAVTNTVTASGNAFTGVTFTPALVADAANDAVVTVSLSDHVMNHAFHRNTYALAMAPLSDIGSELGAKVSSVVDEQTGLAMRARLWYDGDNSRVKVALDVLYGMKTLDPNLACRARYAL